MCTFACAHKTCLWKDARETGKTGSLWGLDGEAGERVEEKVLIICLFRLFAF